MANKGLGGNIPPVLINVVLGVFVLGWISSLAADIFRPEYNAPTGLNEAMIAMVTAFFVAQQRLSGGDDDEDEKPKRKKVSDAKADEIESDGDGGGE